MALMKCRECGAQINDTSKTLPRYMVNVLKRIGKLKAIFLFAILLPVGSASFAGSIEDSIQHKTQQCLKKHSQIDGIEKCTKDDYEPELENCFYLKKAIELNSENETVVAELKPELARCEEYMRNEAAEINTTFKAYMAEQNRVAALPGAKIGMSKKQVLEKTHWGKPTSINTTVNSSGTVEQWVYGDGHYIYFSNGKVFSIQTTTR